MFEFTSRVNIVACSCFSVWTSFTCLSCSLTLYQALEHTLQERMKLKIFKDTNQIYVHQSDHILKKATSSAK